MPAPATHPTMESSGSVSSPSPRARRAAIAVPSRIPSAIVSPCQDKLSGPSWIVGSTSMVMTPKLPGGPLISYTV